jgi:hypothetical protein
LLLRASRNDVIEREEFTRSQGFCREHVSNATQPDETKSAASGINRS